MLKNVKTYLSLPFGYSKRENFLCQGLNGKHLVRNLYDCKNVSYDELSLPSSASKPPKIKCQTGSENGLIIIFLSFFYLWRSFDYTPKEIRQSWLWGLLEKIPCFKNKIWSEFLKIYAGSLIKGPRLFQHFNNMLWQWRIHTIKVFILTKTLYYFHLLYILIHQKCNLSKFHPKFDSLPLEDKTSYSECKWTTCIPQIPCRCWDNLPVKVHLFQHAKIGQCIHLKMFNQITNYVFLKLSNSFIA